MTPRSIKLLAVLGVLALGWLAWWMFRPTPQLTVELVRMPGQPIIFAFNGQWVLDEVRVEPDQADGSATPVWHLVRNERRDEADVPHPAVTYGKPPRGMRTADRAIPRNGKPLERQKPYRLTVRAGASEATLPFILP